MQTQENISVGLFGSSLPNAAHTHENASETREDTHTEDWPERINGPPNFAQSPRSCEVYRGGKINWRRKK